MIIILIFKVKRYFEIGTFRRKKERLSKVFQAIVGKKALSDRYPKTGRCTSQTDCMELQYSTPLLLIFPIFRLVITDSIILKLLFDFFGRMAYIGYNSF